MAEAFICDAIRTPIGRYGGALVQRPTDDLAALPLAALMERNPASTGRPSTTSSSAAPTRPARTTATSRAWRRCSPDCRSRCPASRSTGCAAPAWTRWRSPRGDPVRRGRARDRGRRREHDARALRDVEGGSAFTRKQQMYDTTIGWRFVNPLMKQQYGIDAMPETGENVRPSSPSRAPTRTRSPCAASSARRGAGERPAARGDRPGHASGKKGEPEGRRPRRASARDHARGAGEARHAVPGGRHGHRRQCFGRQRRRLRAARGERAAARRVTA